jgi:squalene-associated FAD-dependent desaturase
MATRKQSTSEPSSVAIIGGGLAGLAAAVAAVERGLRVELFEQAGHLGGRAGSLVDSKTGDRIDYCQHVAMGCCTAFLDFCRRTRIDDCFQRCNKLHFIGPEGTQHDFGPSRWLPSPLHLLPGLWKLKYLTPGERLGIVQAMVAMVWTLSEFVWTMGPHGPHMSPSERLWTTSLAATQGRTIGEWLRQQGQSERVIELFWSVVLVSALGETVDQASLAAARKVFCDGFLASRGASDLILPRLPLGSIFHDRLGAWLADHGVTVHLATPIRRIEGDGRRFRAVVLSDGARREFDSAVVAVPWHGVKRFFAEDLLAAMPELANVDRIEPAAITAVHLWFDRPIAPLPHAVLVGRLGEWVFTGTGSPGYCQVVISASHRLPKRTHGQWVADVNEELQTIWPGPRLLHSRVVTQPAAVFSMRPDTDRFRPVQQTPIENLALAGDWTATGWPATMEGAVRSGHRAVEILLEASP